MEKPVMTDTERAWHKTRQMLVWLHSPNAAYIPGAQHEPNAYCDTLHLAEKGDDRGHREWFIDMAEQSVTIEEKTDWLNAYEYAVRGFIDETGIYLYKGKDYICDGDVEALALKFASSPKPFNLVIPTGTHIYGGMIPGEIGVRWKPQRELAVVW